jgi:hypothetical protein
MSWRGPISRAMRPQPGPCLHWRYVRFRHRGLRTRELRGGFGGAEKNKNGLKPHRPNRAVCATTAMSPYSPAARLAAFSLLPATPSRPLKRPPPSNAQTTHAADTPSTPHFFNALTGNPQRRTPPGHSVSAHHPPWATRCQPTTPLGGLWAARGRPPIPAPNSVRLERQAFPLPHPAAAAPAAPRARATSTWTSDMCSSGTGAGAREPGPPGWSVSSGGPGAAAAQVARVDAPTLSRRPTMMDSVASEPSATAWCTSSQGPLPLARQASMANTVPLLQGAGEVGR